MEARWRPFARTGARLDWMQPWMQPFAHTIDAAKEVRRIEQVTFRGAESHREEIGMTDQQRIKYLSYALRVFGAIMLFGFYPLTIVWPTGWSWHADQSDYLLMIIGMYATLGIFLLKAARDPLGHLSLIQFTIWSSLVHGGIMAVQSLADAAHVGHLVGDVPALLLVAAVLALLTPRRVKLAQTEHAA